VAVGRGTRLVDVWEDLGRNGTRRREEGPAPWIDREVDIGWVCLCELSGYTKVCEINLKLGVVAVKDSQRYNFTLYTVQA